MTRAAEKLRAFLIEAEAKMTIDKQRPMQRWRPANQARTGAPVAGDNGSSS